MVGGGGGQVTWMKQRLCKEKKTFNNNKKEMVINTSEIWEEITFTEHEQNSTFHKRNIQETEKKKKLWEIKSMIAEIKNRMFRR